MTHFLIKLAENGQLPDFLLRFRIRQICRSRLRSQGVGDAEQQQARFQALIDQLRQSPIAIETDTANEQHYEVPARFYQLVLGQHLKYSASLFTDEVRPLDEAEAAMLSLYQQRAQLADGQRVL